MAMKKHYTPLLLRPARREDALYLAPRLREADMLEIAASSVLSPLEVILESIRLSSKTVWVLCQASDYKAIAIGGVRQLTDDYGLVWYLATPEAANHAITIQKSIKALLSTIFEKSGYQALANVVSAHNTKAIRWLKHMGFQFVHMHQPIGVHHELFHSFAIRRPTNV